MGHGTRVGGVQKSVTAGLTLVGGVQRKITKGLTLVGGVQREIVFASEIPVGELDIGSSIYLNVSGVPTEFLVVHQGNPDPTIYDSSCDGTWLLMKDIYTEQTWGRSGANYSGSTIAGTYLKNTFKGLLDTSVQSLIKTVKIPYVSSLSGTVRSGSSGYSCQIFLLSAVEAGFSNFVVPSDGAFLSYFSSEERSFRVAYMNGVATEWWVRTLAADDSNYIRTIDSGGGLGYYSYGTDLRGVRPAFILPQETLVDGNLEIIA